MSKVIPSNKYTLGFGFGSAQPSVVERNRNPVDGYSLYRESPNITIDQLEPDLSQRLEQRAAQHGRTIEAEIKFILSSVLNPPSTQLVGGSGAFAPAIASPIENLATAIDRRFADLGEFELPETPRDAMRAAPNFAAE